MSAFSTKLRGEIQRKLEDLTTPGAFALEK